METIGRYSTLETLRAGLRGTAYAAGEEGYDEACRAWNLNARQEPALVVMAEGAADVMAAVSFARGAGMGVGVMATGHGMGAPCDGGVLVNTSRMRGVRVDPVARTARVEAGALWTDVIPEAQAHGLAGLVGSSSHVGVVGYTMGGGFGWLGRRFGLNAASVTAADVVTADGELLRVSADEHPDLFWGLGGGGGNFGIVASLEFKLHPLTVVYGGNAFYPVERARGVMDAISMDPVDPMASVQHSEMLRDLSPEAIEALLEVAGPDSGSPLIMLEIRQLGGALARTPGRLSPMGGGKAGYIMNGVGVTFTPEMAEGVKGHLARVTEATREHQTGETYVNFMELDAAGEERVRAAYAPEDWERLVALKDRLDPDNFFRFNRNIAPSEARR